MDVKFQYILLWKKVLWKIERMNVEFQYILLGENAVEKRINECFGVEECVVEERTNEY